MAHLTEAFKQQIEAAQHVSLDIQQVASENMYITVQALANAVGCPKEFIFFPLLSACAGMMGANAVVRINPEWKEPAILWTMVAARRGEKKTPALKRVLEPLQEIQTELHREIKRVVPGISATQLPRLCVDDLENLQTLMSQNGKQMIGLFDELSSVFQTFDSDRNQSATLTRNNLSSLYDGLSWSNHANDSAAFMDKTCLNLSGFTSLSSLFEITQKADNARLFDRFLVFIPPSVTYNFADFRVVPENTPQLKKVYSILRRIHHPEGSDMPPPLVYGFNAEALQLFGDYHDEFRRRFSDFLASEDCHSLYSKAIGQVARLSAILQATENAFNAAMRNEEISRRRWNQIITMDKVWCARVIIDYAIQQKLALLPAEVRLVAEVGAATTQPMRYAPEATSVPMTIITPSQPTEPVPTNIIVSPPQAVNRAPTNSMNYTPHTVSEMRYKQGSYNQMRQGAAPSISKRQGVNIRHRYMTNKRPYGGRIQPLSKMTSQELIFNYPKKIKKILEFPLLFISLSTISQKKMMPKQNGMKNAFSTESAKEFVSKISAMGFGAVELKSHPQNGRRSHQFVKRPYEELSEEAKEISQRLRVDIDKYQECFTNRQNETMAMEHFPEVDAGNLTEVNKFEVSRPDCQQENVNTVLIHMPHSADDEMPENANETVCTKVEPFLVE